MSILSLYNTGTPFSQLEDNKLYHSAKSNPSNTFLLCPFFPFSSFSQHNQTLFFSLPPPLPLLLSQYDNTLFSSLLSSSTLFILKVKMSFECKHFSEPATKASSCAGHWGMWGKVYCCSTRLNRTKESYFCWASSFLGPSNALFVSKWQQLCDELTQSSVSPMLFLPEHSNIKYA